MSSSCWQDDLRLIYSQHEIHIQIWTDHSFCTLKFISLCRFSESLKQRSGTSCSHGGQCSQQYEFKKWQNFLGRDHEVGEKLYTSV